MAKVKYYAKVDPRGASDEGAPLVFEHELNELTRIYKELWNQ